MSPSLAHDPTRGRFYDPQNGTAIQPKDIVGLSTYLQNAKNVGVMRVKLAHGCTIIAQCFSNASTSRTILR